jgi:hypothetical protein
MTPHEFQMPVRVDEIRPEVRLTAVTPEVAPSAPVSTDDGLPLTSPPAPAPATAAAR